eukprot:COSAG01_NODE_48546_length_380_cov_0.736655_2_plen_30_part_01
MSAVTGLVVTVHDRQAGQVVFIASHGRMHC